MEANRRGMTILELLLSLALTSIVLYLLGVAIDMQWRLFDTRRSRVEETLLARSVLRRISDDIRGAVLFSPPDLEGLKTLGNNPLTQAAGMISGVGQQGNSPQGQGAGGMNANAQPAEGNGSGKSPDMENPDEPMSSGGPSQRIVGLYGSTNFLAIDVSRLPRMDEYDPVYAPDSTMTPLDIPSDVKTINYYIGSDPTFDAEGTPPPPDTTGSMPTLRGLIRQQMSRAVSSYDQQGGGSDQITGAQILAEEVTAIEFAYFDGTNWLTDWSSSSYGGLPLAVAIAIQVEMKASRVAALTAATLGVDVDVDRVKNSSIHRLVVHLPSARKLQPVPVEGEGGEMEMMDSAAGAGMQP